MTAARCRHASVRAAAILAAITVLACAPAVEDDGGASQAAGEQTAEAMEQTAEATTAEAAAVERAFDAFAAAWEEEDRESLGEIFTDDALVFDPVPPGKFAGTEGIDNLLSVTFEQQDDIEITVSERTVHTEGRVGWMTARYVYEARPAGEDAEPVRDEGYVSTVWVLQPDGSYKLPLFHASPLPVAPQQDGP